MPHPSLLTPLRRHCRYDSFLMGPSGYGYVFPGAMAEGKARQAFAARTIGAASALDMQACAPRRSGIQRSSSPTNSCLQLTFVLACSMLGRYVHWDADLSIDPASRAHTTAMVKLYNHTAVRGALTPHHPPSVETWPSSMPRVPSLMTTRGRFEGRSCSGLTPSMTRSAT